MTPSIIALALSVATAAPPADLARNQTLAPPGLRAPTPQLASRTGEHAHGTLHQVVLWVPNRVLDVLDPFRARVRVGPGVALSLRATEAVDLNVGAYFSLYAGLPGPRNRRLPKLPVGIEMMAGAEVSYLDGAPEFWVLTPDYGETELGVGIHALLVGADVGLEPLEIVDFFGGLVLWDPKHDDL